MQPRSDSSLEQRVAREPETLAPQHAERSAAENAPTDAVMTSGHAALRRTRAEARPNRSLGDVARRCAKSLLPRAAKLDSDVLLRALAIALLVFNHSHPTGVYPGGMALLLLLSGYSFARFGVREKAAAQTRRSLLHLGLRVGLPALALVVFAQLVEQRFNLLELLFVRNWFTVERIAHFPIWYVQVLLQMLLLVYLAFCIPGVGEAFRRRPLASSLIAAALAFAVRALAPLAWDTTHVADHLPHLYLWLFLLGWAVHFAREFASATQLAWLWIPLVAWAGLGAKFAFHPERTTPVLTALGAAWLLTWRTVALPRPAVRAAQIVAQATFVIFLLHREFIMLFRRLPGAGATGTFGRWLFGLLASVAVWLAVTAVWRALGRLRREVRGQTGATQRA